MIRSFKIFGLVTAVMFALTAVAASAASAVEFHGEAAPVKFTGVQKEALVFSTTAGTVKCSTATFVGENATTTSSTMTLSATYGGCKAFGFINVPVTMNGCKYVFHLTSSTEPTTDISCPEGASIQVDAPGCPVTVPAQTGLNQVVLTNTGTGASRDIDGGINLQNIKYITGECILAESGTDTNGTLTGSVTIQGQGQGVWVG